MTPDNGTTGQQQHGGYLFIPAGVLLGLGIGLILGHPGHGVLIGLGLGFLATAFAGWGKNSGPASDGTCCGNSRQVIFLILGVFMIIIALGFLWAPIDVWPYIFGLFLVILGLGLLAKNFRK